MAKITVIYAHPDPEKSLANRNIIDQFHALMPNAEIVPLGEKYPDWHFDIKAEQERLMMSDVLIFEFPVWWYAMPWTLQKYVTDVFAYGFAYGNQYALENKKFILSFTCGGGEKSYTRDGLYHCTIDDIMSPLYATSRYCRLNYIGSIISWHMMPEDCPVADIVEKAGKHAEKLAKISGK